MKAESQRQRQNKAASSISDPSKRKEMSMNVEVDQNAHDADTLMNSVEMATSPNTSTPKRKRHMSQAPTRPRKRSKSSDEDLLLAGDSFGDKPLSPSSSRGPSEPEPEQPAPMKTMKTRRVTPTSPPQSSNSASARSRTTANKGKGKSIIEPPETKKPRKRATEAKLDRSSSPPHRDTSPASHRSTSPIEDANEFPEKESHNTAPISAVTRSWKLAKDGKSVPGSATKASSVTHIPSSSPPTGASASTSTPAVVRSHSTWELANPGKTRRKLDPGQLYADEYIEMLYAEGSNPTGKKKKPKDRLVGAKIYYCGGDRDAVTPGHQAKDTE
ncbi:hypothetical protein MPER_05392, partial [Moniliophthora perniciosa FA553]